VSGSRHHGLGLLDMRKLLPLLVLLLTACVTAQAEQVSNKAIKTYDFSKLAAWVGKSPSSAVVKGGKSFWDDSDLQRALAALLGKDEAKLIYTGWNGAFSESDVTKFGNVINVYICKENDCNLNALELYVDIQKNILQGCYRRANNFIRGEDYWISNIEKSRKLPAEACSKSPGESGYRIYGTK